MPKAWHPALEPKSGNFVDASGGPSVPVASVRSSIAVLCALNFRTSDAPVETPCASV